VAAGNACKFRSIRQPLDVSQSRSGAICFSCHGLFLPAVGLFEQAGFVSALVCRTADATATLLAGDVKFAGSATRRKIYASEIRTE
jgi:hypothetical protein